MSLLQSTLLGIIQGASEFLPISSSGHLALARAIMKLEEIPLLFDVLLHIPTLLAVVLVFRRRIARLLISIGRLVARKNGEEDRIYLRLALVILLATLFTAVVGFAFSILLDRFVFPTKLVPLLFIVTAVILILTAFFRGTRTYGSIGVREGVAVGLAQGFGVLPGISRSGITIATSLFCGMDRERAGEFAFLLSIPATLGALVLKLPDLEILPMNLLVLAAGMTTSFIVGLASLVILMRIIRRGRLYLFSLYLIPLGILTFFLL